MSEFIKDPDLYQRMNVGHPSIKASRAALESFLNEVNQLREKYVIRDIVVMAGAIATVEDERLYVVNSVYRGTPTAAMSLVAQFAEAMDKQMKSSAADGEDGAE